jgi:hypothetical protein
MVEMSHHDDFAPYIGKRFSFVGQAVSLQLAKIDIGSQSAAHLARTSFNLIFHGPAGHILPEGLYRTEIEGGPVTELYIMPIHTVTRDRQEYQAVFN